MGKVVSKDGVLYWYIQNGVTEKLVISKPDGWVYDEILMDFKQDKNINAPSIKSLTVDDGITIVGNDLTIELTYTETTTLNQTKIFSDIKLRTGTTVLPPIPMVTIINQTVTKVA